MLGGLLYTCLLIDQNTIVAIANWTKSKRSGMAVGQSPAFLYFFQPKAYMQLPKMLSSKALDYFVGNYI